MMNKLKKCMSALLAAALLLTWMPGGALFLTVRAEAASYVLYPSGVTVADCGYWDIDCKLKYLTLGDADFGHAGTHAAESIDFYFNSGTMSDGSGNVIPFSVSTADHFSAESRVNAGTFTEQGQSFKATVYVDPADYADAAPGVYTGTLNYDAVWTYITYESAAASGTIGLTMVITDSGDAFYDITVENDGNGTASAVNRTKAKAGTSVTLTAAPTGAADYHFKEWQVVSGGVTVTNNSFTMPASAVTVKAVFEPNTVTFDAQGGTVTTASAVTADGKLAELPAPVRDGWVFDGWYTEAEGGTQITADTVFTGNATAYAHWHALSNFTITFDAQGGTASAETAATTDYKLSALPTASKDGWSFVGWYTEQNGGSKITTGTAFTADTTVYARWGSACTVSVPASAALTRNTEFTPVSVTVSALNFGLDANGLTPSCLSMVFEGGTLINGADSSKTLPFQLALSADTSAAEAQSVLNFTAAGQNTFYLYIPASGWSAAAAGSYSGTMDYSAAWMYSGGENSTVERGSVQVTVTIPKQYTVTAAASDAAMGTVSGGGTCEEGASVTVTAAPNAGYRFVKWTDASGAQVSTDASYTFTPAADVSLTANFAEGDPVTITYTAGAGGSVSTASEQVAPVTGTAAGSAATADTGCRFVNWTAADGSVVSARAAFVPAKVNGLNAAAAYTANFERLSFTVTWKNADGSKTLSENTAQYGEKPVFIGAEPTKASDSKYTYTFAGWSTEANAETGTQAENLPAVTGTVTYYAAFGKTAKKSGSSGSSGTTETESGTGTAAAAPAATAAPKSTAGQSRKTVQSAEQTAAGYAVTKGAGGTWTPEDTEGYALAVTRIDGDSSAAVKLTGVRIDGTSLVEGTDYEVSADGTSVTLKEETLQKLSTGDHTVTMLFEDGETETVLTVAKDEAGGSGETADGGEDADGDAGDALEETGAETAEQETGSGTPAVWWIIPLLLIAAGCIVYFLLGKKRKEEKHAK